MGFFFFSFDENTQKKSSRLNRITGKSNELSDQPQWKCNTPISRQKMKSFSSTPLPPPPRLHHKSQYVLRACTLCACGWESEDGGAFPPLLSRDVTLHQHVWVQMREWVCGGWGGGSGGGGGWSIIQRWTFFTYYLTKFSTSTLPHVQSITFHLTMAAAIRQKTQNTFLLNKPLTDF